jgi:hypothetical protein
MDDARSNHQQYDVQQNRVDMMDKKMQPKYTPTENKKIRGPVSGADVLGKGTICDVEGEKIRPVLNQSSQPGPQ